MPKKRSHIFYKSILYHGFLGVLNIRGKGLLQHGNALGDGDVRCGDLWTSPGFPGNGGLGYKNRAELW